MRFSWEVFQMVSRMSFPCLDMVVKAWHGPVIAVAETTSLAQIPMCFVKEEGDGTISFLNASVVAI